jgi:hypothetical protein
MLDSVLAPIDERTCRRRLLDVYTWSGVIVCSCTANHLLRLACPFRAATGWRCPGCGGTTAFFQLLDGHFRSALQSNAVVLVSAAALAVALVLLVVGREVRIPQFGGRSPSWAVAVVVAAVAWTVVRNVARLPGGIT